MAAEFGQGTNAAKPLQLVGSTQEAAYSKYIDALPYADVEITEAEREMVQNLIDDELRILRQEEHASAAAKELDRAPPTPPAPSASVIDLARYRELGGVEDIDAAKIALEYETGRRLEAQLRLKFGALRYRESNEALASVLQGLEEGVRAVAGDVGMINRERKRACAGVREELGRLAGEYATLVRKNRRLESVVGEMEGS